MFVINNFVNLENEAISQRFSSQTLIIIFIQCMILLLCIYNVIHSKIAEYNECQQ